MKRPTYTVYCETCQRSFFTYVLGRGPVPFGKGSANRRADEHRRDQPTHVVTVKEKA